MGMSCTHYADGSVRATANTWDSGNAVHTYCTCRRLSACKPRGRSIGHTNAQAYGLKRQLEVQRETMATSKVMGTTSTGHRQQLRQQAHPCESRYCKLLSATTATQTSRRADTSASKGGPTPGVTTATNTHRPCKPRATLQGNHAPRVAKVAVCTGIVYLTYIGGVTAHAQRPH